jgi:hypothetical protein
MAIGSEAAVAKRGTPWVYRRLFACSKRQMAASTIAVQQEEALHYIQDERLMEIGQPYIFTKNGHRKVIVIHGSRQGPNGRVWDVGVDGVIGQYGDPADAIGPYDTTTAPLKP